MIKSPQPSEVLKKVVPYEDARSFPLLHPIKDALVKLDCNEAAYSPSPLVSTRLLAYVKNERLQWYPDTESQNLRKSLSGYVGYSSDSIAIFNGCDHALNSICRTYLNPGDEVIVFSPTYDNFRFFVELAGASVVPFYAPSPFQSSIDGFEKLMSTRTKMVYLANPNNPTGTTYTEDQIAHILRTSEVLVVVDEAYYEFWGKTSLSLIRKFPNLIITRSFSKAFGLAGLRCGYLISEPYNVRQIRKVRNGKDVNILAQLAAEAALEDLDYIREQIRLLHKTKEWFVNVLRAKGVGVVDTVANFVLTWTNSPNDVDKILRKNNILVRDRSRFHNMEGYLRITIGTRSGMEKLIKIFSSMDVQLLHSQELLVAPS